jgi:hypothetical protein
MRHLSKAAFFLSLSVVATATFFGWTQPAWAVLLNPGDTLPLPGTTSLAEPQLAATVLVDETAPFSISTSSGEITGSVQQRVERSTVDGTLDFYWRVFNDPNSVGPIGSFRVGDFISPEYNANWRIDGLGNQGPAHAHRFTIPQNTFVNFLFDAPSDGPSGLLPGQSSNYVFLDTTATDYIKTAFYDLTGTGSGTISASFPAYTPGTIPEPASFVLIITGVATLLLRGFWRS